MNKKDVVHIRNGILFNHEKGGYSPVCDNMDRRWAHYVNETNQTKKDKYSMISLDVESKKVKPMKNSRLDGFKARDSR